jgi:hypothetical protein
MPDADEIIDALIILEREKSRKRDEENNNQQIQLELPIIHDYFNINKENTLVNNSNNCVIIIDI